jgi:erythromycin esterase-like protein
MGGAKSESQVLSKTLAASCESFVAIEGDWPDAARVDHYVRHFEYAASEWQAFARFPVWMWRNEEVRDFVDWLREQNTHAAPEGRVAFHGLDLYSLYTSIRAILSYPDDVDPKVARIARERYGCLTPWQADPATYGQAALTRTYGTCEGDVTKMLIDLRETPSMGFGRNRTATGGEHIRFSETHSQGVGQLGTDLPPRPGYQDSLIVHRGSVKRSPLEAFPPVVLQS